MTILARSNGRRYGDMIINDFYFYICTLTSISKTFMVNNEFTLFSKKTFTLNIVAKKG